MAVRIALSALEPKQIPAFLLFCDLQEVDKSCVVNYLTIIKMNTESIY
jgi:hypothetical protein